MVEAELDAGSDAVLAAILTTDDAPPGKEEGPREPAVEGDEPAPDEDSPDEGEEQPSEEEETKDAADEGKEEVEVEDVDELLVEITVNGQNIEVPLKELKQNYSGNKFIEQNIQKAVEVRKAIEYNAAALYNANKQAVEKLQSLDAVLDSMTQSNIDWAALKARNPQEYILKREEVRELEDKQKLVQQEIDRVEAEQAALQSQARQRLVMDQAQLLAQQVPGLNDPQTAPVVMGHMVRAAEHYGFSREEVGTVLDHRQMLVLYDAAQWRHYVAQQNQVRRKANGNGDASASPPQQRKVLIRPGSSQNAAETRSKRLTADAYNRARKSGSVEDVAMTLLMPSKRR